MKRVLECMVSPGDSQRTVGFILEHRMGLSAGQVRSLKFRPGGILLNGERVRTSARVQEGDCLCAALEDTRGCPLIPADGGASVVYEDEDLVVVDKPSGVVVHPSPGHYADSLLNRLRQQGFSGLHPIGRLDRDTSGLMIFAKHRVAAFRLEQQRAAGRFRKLYLALVSGTLPRKTGCIDAPVGRMPDGGMRMEVRGDGKPARTEYRVAGEYGTCTLTAFRLDTGRTHQIRVHMASMGHPLLGDPLYGAGAVPPFRAALHAAAVGFDQPFTGAALSFEAPLPADLKALIPEEPAPSAWDVFG